jgi:hypothetical protein
VRFRDTSVEFDQATLLAVIYQTLAASEHGAIPGILEAIATYPEEYFWQSFDPDEMPNEEAQQIAVGAYFTIACNDGINWGQSNEVATSDLDVNAGHLWEFPPCQDWPVFPVTAVGRDRVSSSVPTLILAGELDPLTPREYALVAAATLSRAHVFVLPMVGHGVLWTQPCASTIVEAFLDQPTARPHVTCPSTSFDAARSLQIRAAYVAQQGKLADAGRMLEQLLAYQEARSAGHFNLARTLSLLGAVYHEQQRLTLAATTLERALAIIGKAYSLDSVEAGDAAGHLADVYYDLRRWEEARTMYRRALRALEDKDEGDGARAVQYKRREQELETRRT